MKHEITVQPTIHTVTLTASDIEEAIWEWVAKNTEVGIPTTARMLINDTIVGRHGIELNGRISWEENKD